MNASNNSWSQYSWPGTLTHIDISWTWYSNLSLAETSIFLRRAALNLTHLELFVDKRTSGMKDSSERDHLLSALLELTHFQILRSKKVDVISLFRDNNLIRDLQWIRWRQFDLRSLVTLLWVSPWPKLHRWQVPHWAAPDFDNRYRMIQKIRSHNVSLFRNHRCNLSISPTQLLKNWSWREDV